MRELQFFYFFGSVYSYLAVMRLRRMADAAGVRLAWRPFNVRPLMQENNVAMRREERKVTYMWRDVERRAALHGLPFRAPPVWPTDPELLHNRVGTLAADGGWIEPFTMASFRGWMLEGKALGDRSWLETLVSDLGQDPQAVLAAAETEETASRLEANTDVARRHGIFGAPSFVTADGEMFWGDDRLEEAIAWASGTHPRQ